MTQPHYNVLLLGGIFIFLSVLLLIIPSGRGGGGGGRILLIGDLNICFECYSILNTCDVRQSF